MYTLFLDSSNKNLSVAIYKNGKQIEAVDYDAWQRQSELMVDEIAKLFTRNNIEFKSLNSVVVASGPGSYTGVRIAVTIAKVIAFSLNIPLYSLSSLAILSSTTKPTICLINARASRSFIGVYQGKEVLLADCILENDKVLEYINCHKEYAIAGEGNHLNLQVEQFDRFERINDLISEESRVKDIIGFKPVYLKD